MQFCSSKKRYMLLILLTLVTIIVLYFIFAFLPSRICAICAAVSLTWLGLLFGYFMGWHNNLLWLGILMGGSVVGLSYKLETYFKKNNLTNFWLIRIFIIVFGFLAVYLFLNQDWDRFSLFVVIAVLFSFLSLFVVKKDKPTKNSKFTGELREKLDHCCD